MFAEQLDDHLDELARHYGRTDNVTKAVEYLGRAGQQALQRSAYADAIGSLSAAISLLQKLPDNPERARRELRLQLALSQVFIIGKGWSVPEVERALTRARELCERVGETPELFPALGGLWGVHLMRGELRTAYELAEHFLRRVQSAHDPVPLQYAQLNLGTTLFRMGELLLAREHLEEGMHLYDPERHRPVVGIDSGVGCLSYGAWTLWHLGYPDQALKRGNEARASAQRHSPSLAFAELFLGVLHQFRGEVCAAQETAERVIALSAERGLTDYLARATTLRGWAITEQGLNEEGIGQTQEGLAASRAIGTELYRPHFLCFLAEACRETGRLDDGLHALTEAIDAAEEQENRHYEAEMHRLKGELLLKQDDSNAAEAQGCFRRAIEIARKQSAKSLELRATVSLARLLAQQACGVEARSMLAEIYQWFTEGFDTADLKDAKALLDELTT
jgi:predicted ATPase